MALTAPVNESNFTLIPAGTYAARCYQIIHSGTVPENINGKVQELNKIRLVFETPAKKHVFKEGEEPKPFSVSKEFTFSMSDRANLRKALEGWRSRQFTDKEAAAFDISKLLGVPCMITVIHKTSKSGKVRAEISSISSLPEGMTVPPQINESFLFTVSEFSDEKFNKLSNFFKEKVQSSLEYKQLFAAGTVQPQQQFTKEQQDMMHGEEHERRIIAESVDNIKTDDLPF